MGDVVAQIAAAAEQQAQGVGQINTAVEDMNAVTQQVAANAEEAAAAAEELSAQSTMLDAMVAEFAIGEDDEAPALPPSRTAGWRAPVTAPAAPARARRSVAPSLAGV